MLMRRPRGPRPSSGSKRINPRPRPTRPASPGSPQSSSASCQRLRSPVAGRRQRGCSVGVREQSRRSRSPFPGIAAGTACACSTSTTRPALALQKATHPEPSPAQQMAEARPRSLDCERSCRRQPSPPRRSCRPLSRSNPVQVSSALGSEMKDAIESDQQRAEGLENQAGNVEERDRELEQPHEQATRRTRQPVPASHRISAKSEEYKSAVTDAMTRRRSTAGA